MDKHHLKHCDNKNADSDTDLLRKSESMSTEDRKRPLQSRNSNTAIDTTSITSKRLYTSTSTNTNTSADQKHPLKGVVVCLTGLPPDQKNRLHKDVQDLGGKYARHLDTSQTTHLIALIPQGEKYQTALSKYHIFILTPDWLEACVRERRLVSEEDYRLVPHPINISDGRCTVGGTNTTVENNFLPCSLDTAIDHHLLLSTTANDNVPLVEEKQIIKNSRSRIFMDCRFFLLGFKNEPCATENNGQDHGDDTTTMANTLANKHKLCRLIRKGMGTIYWEINESITHIITSDEHNQEISSRIHAAARRLSLHHSNGPASVSPWWVLQSYKKGVLVAPFCSLPTNYKKEMPGSNSGTTTRILPYSTTLPMKTNTTRTTNKSKLKPTFLSSSTSKKRKSATLGTNRNLFQGSLFCILRLAPPTDGIDFDVKELQKTIQLYGGQLVASNHSKWLDALKADANQRENPKSKRNCYVIHWGGEYTYSHVTMHPFLGQVIRLCQKTCSVIPVTPIWLQTVTSTTMVGELRKGLADTPPPPEQYCPLLFQPQTWSMLRLPVHGALEPKNICVNAPTATKISKAIGQKSSHKIHQIKIKISVTGFVGYERNGIIRSLQAMGAEYTDTLTKCTTHLIVAKKNEQKNQRSSKTLKAIEWGLHVVSEQWLYHTLRHGYYGNINEGKRNGKQTACESGGGGCEDQFSLCE